MTLRAIALGLLVPLAAACGSQGKKSGASKPVAATPGANGTASGCPQTLQQQMLAAKSVTFPTDAHAVVDTSPANQVMASAPPTKQLFQRSGLNGSYNSLELAETFTSGSEVVHLTQTLSQPTENSDATTHYFTLDTEFMHLHAGQLVQQSKVTQRYDRTTCQPSFAAVETIKATYSGQNVTLVRDSDDLIGQLPTHETKSTSSTAIDNSERYSDASSVPAPWSGVVYGGWEMPELTVQVAPGAQKSGPDPLSGGTATFDVRTVTYLQNGATVATVTLALSKSSAYNVETFENLGTTETVDQKNWLATPMSSAAGDQLKVQMQGFTPADTYASAVSYQVDAKSQLTFDNYAAYFQLDQLQAATQGAYSYRVTAQMQQAVADLQQPMPSYAGGPLAQYLQPSYYFTISDPAVQALVTKVRAELPAQPLQSDVIAAILKEVTGAIQYDYNALSQDNVTLMRANDALARGKGVCQHFAAVFVTLSRALGLPARVVSGLYLSGDQKKGTVEAGYHAWVEVAVSGKWLPLEPQDGTDLQLPTLDYFPVGVMTSYERQAGATEDLSSLIAQEKAEAGMVLTKISSTPVPQSSQNAPATSGSASASASASSDPQS